MEIFSHDAFHHKTVIIIGGAGDIGSEIAIQFAKSGTHSIALLEIGLNKIASQLKNTTAQVLQIKVDLADENQVYPLDNLVEAGI